MHNWEHYSRLPAYFLAAALVASCGGGSDDTLVGQSSDTITVSSGANVVIAPIDGAVDISVTATRDGVAVKQQTATISILSGEGALLATGSSEPVRSLIVKTNDSGVAAFKLRGLAKNSVGQILVSYVDSANKQTSKTISYQVGDNLNVAYNLALNPATGSDNVIATTGPDSVVNIVATLKDKLNQPVANQSVEFATTIGKLAKTVVTTNSLGEAVVQLSGVGLVVGTGIVSTTFIDSDGNKASNSMTVDVINDFKIDASVASNDIPTGTSDIVLTAFVLDATGTTVSDTTDAKIRFEVVSGGGSISNVSAIKDGIVTAKYTLPKDNQNKEVKLRAVLSGSGISTTNPPVDVIDLNLSGTQVSLTSNKVNVSDQEEIELNLLLKDGKGVGLSGQQLTLTGTGLTFIGSPTVVTLADGTAKAKAKVNTSGASTASATVTNTGLNVNPATVDLAVSLLSFDINPPSAAALPINSDHTMTINLTDGTPVNGRKVKVSSTLGTLSSAGEAAAVVNVTIVDATPDDAVHTGAATFTLNSAFPGEALVKAQAQKAVGASTYDLKTAEFISLVSTTPEKLTIQAENTNLTPNSSTVLTAKVLDDKDNPVAGVDVAFSRAKDPSNGALSDPIVATDKNGIAKVTFTAGALTTAFGAIEISSSLPDHTISPAKSVQKLTVGGEALFVSIGTGNVIKDLDDTKTTYSLPHQIIVTDATGAPSINKDVTLSVVPLEYYKGFYVLVGDEWQANRVATCVNEDANQNGILELIENNKLGDNIFGATDVLDNGDGILWPGSPITLSAKTVRTNEKGVANFDVIYAKSYASWLSAKVIATASVGGSETKAERTFATVAAVPDLKKDTSPPGGITSPFGTVKTGDDDTDAACTYVYYPK